MRKHPIRWFGLLVAFALVAATVGAAANAHGNRAQVLRMSIGAEPPSLDPGLATDTTSADILLNIMDPLFKLGPAPALKPIPDAVASYKVRGATVTLHLRRNERWTNGKPVTAQDYVWSWLRTISPQLAADYAYQFYGIKGAQAYNNCSPSAANNQCNTLRSKVAIKAVGKYTLVIHLIAPQAWFIQQLSHNSFLPVYKPSVLKYGSHWTEASHIVTDGPFKLAAWHHDASLTLTKNAKWRNAKSVHLSRIEMPIIVDGTSAVNAFNAGNIDIDTSGIPPAQIKQLKHTRYLKIYPSLGTYYYGINVKNISDVNQRRAMAYAINRNAIIDNIAQLGEQPARGFTPVGISGGPTILKNSHLPANGNMTAARNFMKKVAHPKRSIHLYINNSAGHINIAVYVQSLWKNLGLDVSVKTMEWKQYLQFLGPPPNNDVDVYRLGWIADYPDAYNFLSLWECNSGNNNTNWCNHTFDSIVEKAGKTQSVQKRVALYQKAESMLTGTNGQLPIVPIYWYTFGELQKTYVHGFSVNPMDQWDLTKVSLR